MREGIRFPTGSWGASGRGQALASRIPSWDSTLVFHLFPPLKGETPPVQSPVLVIKLLISDLLERSDHVQAQQPSQHLLCFSTCLEETFEQQYVI